MLTTITLEFNAALTRIFGEKPEVLSYLLNHERKNICIERLCEQAFIAERKMRGQFTTSGMLKIVDAGARIFAKAALDTAEVQAMSHAEKMRQRVEADHIKDCEAAMVDLEKEALDKRLHSFPGQVAR